MNYELSGLPAAGCSSASGGTSSETASAEASASTETASAADASHRDYDGGCHDFGYFVADAAAFVAVLAVEGFFADAFG